MTISRFNQRLTIASLVTVLLGATLNAHEIEKKNPPLAQVMSREKSRKLLAQIPKIKDKNLTRILSDERLIVYTEQEMPRAYQQWDGELQGVHSAYYNISANGSEPFGNANREFPWSGPAGTHRSDNIVSFRFLWLPVNMETGKQRPIVWFQPILRGDTNPGYAWRFPVGTVFGEVLQVSSPKGKVVTCEVRIRMRKRDAWAVDAFRPFGNAESLAKRIKQLRPKWQEDEQLAKLVNDLTVPVKFTRFWLRNAHPTKSFEQPMGIDELPPIKDQQLVEDLLTKTPFETVVGVPWRVGTNGIETYAPTTKSDFNIVPRNYDAGFIEVNAQSCMRCHETVNQHVRRFEPGRDWYGRVRGSDGIFSFHPFAPSSISPNGIGRAIHMRKAFVEAGILERYDDKNHPRSHYTSIPEFVE